MSTPPAVRQPGPWTYTIVLGAIVVGAIALWGLHPWKDNTRALPERFNYDLGDYKKTDPAWVRYRETGSFRVPLEDPRAIAVGPNDRVYVAGDREIVVFDPQGAKAAQVDLDDSPRCLTVAAGRDAPDGLIYVGMKEHVEVYDARGARRAVWPSLGEKALLTSIAAAETDVFVADAGNRIVWHYDTAGKRLKPIGKRDPDRHIPGFVIPSPYFDLALSPDGLLRVANPGGHRVEGYTFDGDLEVTWGKPSLALEGFCGCCNPANFTLLPDGSFVTVEKGLPRVKVYTPEGELAAVVAGPEHLAPTATITEETRADHKLAVFDVAADRRGRVLLLDPTGKRVRVFEARDQSAKNRMEAESEGKHE